MKKFDLVHKGKHHVFYNIKEYSLDKGKVFIYHEQTNTPYFFEWDDTTEFTMTKQKGESNGTH